MPPPRKTILCWDRNCRAIAVIREHQLLVEPRELLIYVLREKLNLTGPHGGCETSHCGACTVELGGKSVKSCTLFAVQANGAEITTIEGMGCSRKRVEDARFTQGKGNYIDDIKLPGMLHGDFVRSPYAHARVKSINIDAVMALDGVVAVLGAGKVGRGSDGKPDVHRVCPRLLDDRQDQRHQRGQDHCA